MRINYVPILRFILFFLPPMVICFVLDVLGISTIDEQIYKFMHGISMIVAICFFSGIIYLIYAMVHNAMVEAKKE